MPTKKTGTAAAPDPSAWVERVRGGGAAQETRLLSLLAGAFPEAAGPEAVDPKLGVLTEPFLLRLAQAGLDARTHAGLLVVHSDRLAEVRGTRGPAVAEQLLRQLADALRGRLEPSECLARVGTDALAALISPSVPAAALPRAQALYREAQEASRFPLSAGFAHSQGLSGARELLDAARQAAEASRRDGSRAVFMPGAAGPVTASGPGEGRDIFGPTLAARYQRLVLLNRMSLELFADKPFSEALDDACTTILALTGAKCAAVYFSDDFGQPLLACRRGEEAFSGREARLEEEAALIAVFRERRPLSSKASRRGWLAAPFASERPRSRPAEDGAVIVAYPEPSVADRERERTLVEIARTLRSARLMQLNIQQQKTMAAVSEQSADAIYLTDLKSRVASWNSSARELFGYAREDILGRPALLLAPKDKLAEQRAIEEQVLTQGRTRGFDTVALRRDGSLVPVEGTFTLLRDEDGRPFGMVRVFRDITRRKELERMKSEFVSLVSHELRTPLTAIRGFTETILDFWDELAPEKRRHYLEIILQESKRLGNLVTDFLDISRLEAGGVELKPVLLDLAVLARRAAGLLKDHPSRAVFEVAFEPGSEMVWGDEDQLYRVLVNLCSNAVKYSPPSGRVLVSGRSVDSGWVEVGVADQGPGISPQDQERIFQKFFRAADPIAVKHPGTGLGLAICKGIVEAHGGKIWFESVVGRGAVFKFSLPREGLKP